MDRFFIFLTGPGIVSGLSALATAPLSRLGPPPPTTILTHFPLQLLISILLV